MNKSLLIILFMLISGQVFPDSFRCGRTLVKPGESINALIRKCGNPERKFSSKETINDHGHRRSVGVSNWVYKRNGKKDMLVSVHGGSVVKIQVD